MLRGVLITQKCTKPDCNDCRIERLQAATKDLEARVKTLEEKAGMSTDQLEGLAKHEGAGYY
jgi:hypothetical protein